VAALVDTNVLVYLFDPGDTRKQRIAGEVLDRGLQDNSVRIPHQAIVEFVVATTRPRSRGRNLRLPLLTPEEAIREAEELLTIFEFLYPNEALVRTALRGAAAYRLAWYDAHLWAYAEYYGLSELLSEDFEHNRLYGAVRVINPFLT
jgi:predicted nucleic acid-binding protein